MQSEIIPWGKISQVQKDVFSHWQNLALILCEHKGLWRGLHAWGSRVKTEFEFLEPCKAGAAWASMIPGLLPGRWEGDTEAPDTYMHLDYVSRGKMRTMTSVHTHAHTAYNHKYYTCAHTHCADTYTHTNTHIYRLYSENLKIQI